MQTFKREVPSDLQETEYLLRRALGAEGFGVVDRLDVAKTLREELGVASAPYHILAAFSTDDVRAVLDADKDLGVLLPCNVCLYPTDRGSTMVTAIDPLAALPAGTDPAARATVRRAHDRLMRAFERLERVTSSLPPRL
jgi:uncharacterized protein (DUF302 family)